MNLVCPVCGSEYLSWVNKCASCRVALVAPGEAPNPLELPEDQQVVYELGAWPLDLQAEAAAAMAESEIPHAFDGADLVVHLDHEAAVDAIMEAIEAEHGPIDTEAGDGGEPGELVYELAGWQPEHRADLEVRLQAGGVPYRVEDDAIVVDQRDEEAVDFLVAEVRGEEVDVVDLETGELVGDAADDADDGDDDDDDGGYDGELVSSLFDVAARLDKRPDESAALVDFAALNGRLDPERAPFGITVMAWEKVIDAADDLAAALTEDRDNVSLAAGHLKAILRPYV